MNYIYQLVYDFAAITSMVHTISIIDVVAVLDTFDSASERLG